MFDRSGNRYRSRRDRPHSAGGEVGRFGAFPVGDGYWYADYCRSPADFHPRRHRQLIWAKVSPQTEKEYRIPLASGLIAGEAIIAVGGWLFWPQPREVSDGSCHGS